MLNNQGGKKELEAPESESHHDEMKHFPEIKSLFGWYMFYSFAE